MQQKERMIKQESSPTRQTDFDGIFAQGTIGKHENDIEFHYKFALKLRPNFVLAALNLAAHWTATVDQRDNCSVSDPMRLLAHCGLSMDASKTRSFNEHVQAQIECLISGARLCLHSQSKQNVDDDDNNNNDDHDRTTRSSFKSTQKRTITTSKLKSVDNKQQQKQADHDPETVHFGSNQCKQHSSFHETRPSVDESSATTKPMVAYLKADKKQTTTTLNEMEISKQTTACNCKLNSATANSDSSQIASCKMHECSKLQNEMLLLLPDQESCKFLKLAREIWASTDERGNIVDLNVANLKPETCNQFEWLKLARAKASQISASNTKFANLKQQFDLNKQMAIIHWLGQQLNYYRQAEQEQANGLLKKAVQFALKSQEPIEPAVYLDYFRKLNSKESLNDNDNDVVVRELHQFIQSETVKRSQKGWKKCEILARLNHELAKFNVPNSLGIELLREAARWVPSDLPDLQADLAHQAYLFGDLTLSEQLYAKALKFELDKISNVDQRVKQLTKAYTNLGAILQLQGNLNEALEYYKEANKIALQLPKTDLSRKIAQTNLKRLVEKQNVINR